MAGGAAFAVVATGAVAGRVSSAAACSFTAPAGRVVPAAARSNRVSTPWRMQEAFPPAVPSDEVTAAAQPAAAENGGAVAEAVAADDAAAKGTERRSLSKRRTKGGPRGGSQRVVTVQYDELAEGNEYDGTVKAVMDYGCFVDIGTTTDGLIHVSKLGRGFVEKVSDVVTVGQTVRVAISAIDTEKKNFSLRMVLPEGEDAPEGERRGGGRSARGGGGGGGDVAAALTKWYAEYGTDPSKMVTGKVSSVRDFGAFISLEGAPTDGLVHVSQIQEGRVASVAAVLSEGQEVSVRVVECDVGRKRLSLSMKPFVEGGEDSGSGGGPSKAEIEGANAAQPTFRTSFELAFEKAQAAAKSS
eukprot:TRINITY_DN917_c0_g1_i1.p2 TRINITY_DN917_c0_g1~~TRINITY_DN917_c0_g1_i1.p2  ORF type:complete len:410 (+),score=149.48 TRINITY_DN917_c0_g1_i1:160-1230(+)